MTTRREFLRSAAGGLALARLGAGEGAAEAPGQERPFQGARAGEPREVEGVSLSWCPPGRFVMGSPPGETGRRADEEQVRVTPTRGFWISRHEVTQGAWRRIAGEFPDREPSAEFGVGDDFPVYWVSFDEAERFCARLTERAHRSRALPAGWRFRLPTEAQWEYACRAGTTTATAFGDRLGHDQANFNGEPLNGGRGGPAPGRATRVGSYPANGWGIFDMHGNLFEWCRDWYHARLPGGTDPDLSLVQGARNRDGSYSRVRRGGAWNDPGWACRSAMRLKYEPHRRSDHIGFRVVAVEG